MFQSQRPVLDRPPRVMSRPPHGYPRLNVIIDHELAEAITNQARAEMLTKSALVRRTLRQAIKWVPSSKDPLDALYAFADFEI